MFFKHIVSDMLSAASSAQWLTKSKLRPPVKRFSFLIVGLDKLCTSRSFLAERRRRFCHVFNNSQECFGYRPAKSGCTTHNFVQTPLHANDHAFENHCSPSVSKLVSRSRRNSHVCLRHHKSSVHVTSPARLDVQQIISSVSSASSV